jgi:hypothetical protein
MNYTTLDRVHRPAIQAPISINAEIQGVTYQMLLEEMNATDSDVDKAVDAAIAQWVLQRRNHRRMMAKELAS